MKDASIDLRAWRQFVAVAEELHFGRAAARLHMTQPPVTQAIAQLERNLGVALFERSRRRVALTPAAEVLLPEVRELLLRAQALPARARSAAAGEIGRIRLAFVSTIGFGPLPAWVRAFRTLAPRVALELVEATGDVQLEALTRHEIDAGLVLHSPGGAPQVLERMTVSREPLVLALPAQHALAGTGALSQLLAEPLVLFPRRVVPSLHDAITAMYHAAGRMPAIIQEAIQMQTIVNLVSAGIGVAWVPESVMQFKHSGVVYRTARELFEAAQERGQVDLPECETSLVWPAAPPNPALARFIDFVRTQIAP